MSVTPQQSAEIRDSIWFQQEKARELRCTAPMYGVNAWRRNGFRCLRLHFSADPDKSPATPQGRKFVEAIQEGTPTYAFLQERCIDHTVTPGKPVYCDFDRIIIKPQPYRPWLVLFRAWDFGWRMPAAMYFQVEPKDDGTLIVHLLREVIWRELLISDFADRHVLPCVETYYPGATIEDYGDIAGNQHDDKSPETSIEILATRNVFVKTRAMSIDEGIQIWQAIISASEFEVDPIGCKTTIEGLRGGYVRDDQGFPRKDGYYEHIMDCIRYGLANVFRLKSGEYPDSGKRAELARIVTTSKPADHQKEETSSGGLKRPGY